MDNEQELPQGWVWTTLGTLGEYINGKAFNDNVWSREGRPIIRIQDLTGTGKAPNYYNGEIEERYIVHSGDLLIAWSATLGAYIWHGPEACLNQHIFKVISYVDRTFHYYLVQSIIDELYRQAHGSGMVHVTRGVFESINVSLPPLPEQHRIVSALEEQFTRLDAAIASLQQDKARLKQARASVLKAAAEGALTETWRTAHPDVEPAEKLLERILLERREKWEANLRTKGKDPTKVKYVEPVAPDIEGLPGLPEGWCWATVEQLSNKVVDGTHHTPTYVETGIPFLSVKDIRNGRIFFDDCKYISEQEHEELSLRCDPELDDVLITKSGTIGRVAVVDTDNPFSLFVSVALIKTIKSYLVQRYFKLALEYYILKINVQQDIKGVAIKNLHLEDLRIVALRLPPLAEQEQTVAEAEQRLSVIAQAEIVVETSLKRAERTRQSILQKAFSGQLVPQDPDDEPARVLLERIRVEREQRILEEQQRKKEERMNRPRVARKTSSGKEQKPLVEVLQEEQGRLSPVDLFKKAGLDQDDVEDVERFHVELLDEVQVHKSIRLVPSGREEPKDLLEAVDQ